MNHSLTTGPAALVSGAPVAGDEEVVLVNPADISQVTHHDVVANSHTVRSAVAAASSRQESWGRSSPRAVSDVLQQMADHISARAADLAATITLEMGKLQPEALREVDLATRVFRYAAQHALRSRGRVYRSNFGSETVLFTRSRPVGVTAVITPWNFPVGIAAWKIASALALGNTLVWKPSEVVPRSSLLLMDALLASGIPPDAIHLVLGTGPGVGTTLVTDPEVAAITFTGSTAAGRAIQRAAPTKKTQLEMGGKNSTTVWNDVDLDTVARRIIDAAFGGAGQRCTATSRVLVHHDVVDAFTETLAAHATAVTIGPPDRPTTSMGPLATGAQLTKTRSLVDDAVRAGAVVAAGGDLAVVDGPEGLYFQPSVLCAVPPSAVLRDHEVFGPVVEVVGVSSLDEAISTANATPYGLSASIFTHRLDVALPFTDRVASGVVKVNQITSGNEMHVPFGGLKESGFGPPEQGESIDEFFATGSTVSIAGLTL